MENEAKIRIFVAAGGASSGPPSIAAEGLLAELRYVGRLASVGFTRFARRYSLRSNRTLLQSNILIDFDRIIIDID